MGVLNLTHDSFYSSSQYLTTESAFQQATIMAHEGAAIIDIGAESTRPGAKAVATQEQLDRLLPVIEKIYNSLDVVISVDTSSVTVMRESINMGVKMINDVQALQQEGVIEMLANYDVLVCLMHMQGTPTFMQNNPTYTDVVSEVKSFLSQRVEKCIAAGIKIKNIILDPGFGFGKTLQHNLQLLNNLSQLLSLKLPILVGLSRKSMVGDILRKSTADRLYGSLAATSLAILNGANIIRTHDVTATLDTIKIIQAANSAKSKNSTNIA